MRSEGNPFDFGLDWKTRNCYGTLGGLFFLFSVFFFSTFILIKHSPKMKEKISELF